MHTLDTITGPSGNYRVRIITDDDPQEPYDDGAAPILREDRHPYSFTSWSAANTQAAPYVDGANRLAHRGNETVKRWLHIFHGVTVTDHKRGSYQEYGYLAFDPEEWRAEVGAPLPLDVSDLMPEWRAYIAGNVYGVLVEQRRSYSTTYSDGETANGEEWHEIASCYGYYGDDYAQQAARETLAEYDA